MTRQLNSGINPNVIACPGSVTALRMAIENHQEAVVRLLLNRGANPDDGINLAVDTSQVGIARLLIAKGVDINIKNNGQSLLDVAEQKGDKKMMQALKSETKRP